MWFLWFLPNRPESAVFRGIDPAPGVELEVEGVNRIHVRGIDKQQVGQLAAQIRAVRPPNVYTGKGIRYTGEAVRLKPGKSARRA